MLQPGHLRLMEKYSLYMYKYFFSLFKFSGWGLCSGVLNRPEISVYTSQLKKKKLIYSEQEIAAKTCCQCWIKSGPRNPDGRHCIILLIDPFYSQFVRSAPIFFTLLYPNLITHCKRMCLHSVIFTVDQRTHSRDFEAS